MESHAPSLLIASFRSGPTDNVHLTSSESNHKAGLWLTTTATNLPPETSITLGPANLERRVYLALMLHQPDRFDLPTA
jgi:hypothetical protein